MTTPALGINTCLFIDGPVKEPLELSLLFHLENFNCSLKVIPHSSGKTLVSSEPLLLDQEIRFQILISYYSVPKFEL